MSSDRPRVLVGGAINTDLVVRVERAPAAGETVTGTDFAIFPGGKGANQAVAAARAGAQVTMLGGLGEDEFGRQRLADLEADGIDTRFVHIDAEADSGVAAIIVDASGENRIAYVPGATREVAPPVAIDAVEAAQPPCILATLELHSDTLAALWAQARQHGATIICNATPEPSHSADLALAADILIVNETETLELLQIDGEPRDWAAAAESLRLRGPRSVVLTLGSSGAVVVTEAGALAIAALQVGVVDTTGAGDAFCGAFAAELARGATVEDAARIGVVAGSLAVTKPGAQPSMPTRAEIDARSSAG